MQWLVTNFPAVLSVISALLGVAVLVLHLAHKDDVAATIEAIEADIAKLQGK